MKTLKLMLLVIISAVFVLSCSDEPTNPNDGPATPVEDSPARIQKVVIQSQALGIPKSFNIYLPKGYDESTDRYPSVYLFRGHEDEWRDYGIKNAVDSLIDSSYMGKMILVMPGLTFQSDPVVGFPVNMMNREILGTQGGLGTGQFEDYLAQDLIPYVDSAFRTKANREFRGTDGFSGGAYSAIMIALKHPELFSTAGCFDGPFGWTDFDDPTKPGQLDDSVWMNFSNFDPYFGKPRNMDYMSSYNPADILTDASMEQLEMISSIHFFIHSANPEATSGFIEGSYYPRTKNIVDKLAFHGISNYFDEIIFDPAADHTWPYAIEHIEVTLPLHWSVFEE